jgi:hypothetical protein
MTNLKAKTEDHVCSNCGGHGSTKRWEDNSGKHYNAYYETNNFFLTECKDCDFTLTNDHS